MRSPRKAVLLSAVGLLCLGGVACSSEAGGAQIDETCDAAAVGEEIGHIVGESTLTFEGLHTLQCSGDWSYAVAVVGGGTQTASASAALSPFLFLKTNDVLVLKSAPTVCGADGEDQVPADLAEFVCP